MHERLFFQVQCSGWPPHPFLQTTQAHNLYNTTTTACKHSTNQKQVKPAGKIPKQKIMLKFSVYFSLFSFTPVEKECHAVHAGKPKRWHAKQWRQQLPLHQTYTNKQKKQNKAKKSSKLQENFYFYLVNHRESL